MKMKNNVNNDKLKNPEHRWLRHLEFFLFYHLYLSFRSTFLKMRQNGRQSRILNKIQDGGHFRFLQLLPWQQQVINWLFLSNSIFIANKTMRNQKLSTCQVESRLDSVTKLMGGGGGGRNQAQATHPPWSTWDKMFASSFWCLHCFKHKDASSLLLVSLRVKRFYIQTKRPTNVCFTRIQDGGHFEFLQLLPWQQQLLNWLFFVSTTSIDQVLITCQISSLNSKVFKIPF